MTTTTTTPRAAPARDGTIPAPDATRALVARWRRDGTTFVIVDERGRHRDALAAGRVDLTRAGVADARWINATLHRAGFVLLDAGDIPRASRQQAVGRALAAVQRLRARTGRPAWVRLPGPDLELTMILHQQPGDPDPPPPTPTAPRARPSRPS
jgi:hypothetical protein